MFNFRKAAISTTTLSDLMVGRSQMKTEDIAKKYPDGFTVIGFDTAVVEGKAFPVVVIAEDPTIYFNGGKILGKITEEWTTEFGGDIDGANAELAASGGVKMRFTLGKTKDGSKNLTKIEIV